MMYECYQMTSLFSSYFSSSHVFFVDGDDHPPPNTSFQSSYSDEGLDLSQQLAESMFAGPDLDADGEELITSE